VPDPDWIHISAFGIYFILLLTKSVFLSILSLQIEALEMDDTDDNTQTRSTTTKIELGSTLTDTREYKASKEYERVYDKFLRFGKASLDSTEFRALRIGTDASMGYVVPTTFEKNMVKALEDNNIMRSLCRVGPDRIQSQPAL